MLRARIPPRDLPRSISGCSPPRKRRDSDPCAPAQGHDGVSSGSNRASAAVPKLGVYDALNVAADVRRQESFPPRDLGGYRTEASQ
jgi:hypothetical protein